MIRYTFIVLMSLFFLMGCSKDDGGDTTPSKTAIDHGSYAGAWGSYSGPFDEKGSLYYYNLSCNTGYSGNFTVYDDYSVLVETSKVSENCGVTKVYYNLTVEDISDINCTKYGSYTSSSTTWYDTSTKIYYDTAEYKTDGQMIGIVNNGFEALIQDPSGGGTQTIRLYSTYMSSTDYDENVNPAITPIN